jgi:type II secretory pathway component GspD/PulD (secretin)
VIIFRKKFNYNYFMCFGLATAMIFFCSVLSANEVAVIKVKYRKAAELVPVVQSMLSADGSVTVSQRVNSLVIVDNPEAIRRVYAYLERFDQPVEQVRIRVRFNTNGSNEERAVAARGRYSDENVSIDVGRKKKDGVEISGQDRRHRQSSTFSAFVVAMSGSPAFIRTGEEIPYQQGSAFFRRHAPGDGMVTWQTAESGFEVTPVVAGDIVHLKIVPFVAYDERKDGVIRFFGARTELITPFGQWVEIGGTADQKNEIIREILSQSKSGGNSVNSISIMVERP